MKREVGIDYLKGCAILLLIWSHCIPEINPIKIWIFSWHMPVFFIVCGMLSARKDIVEYSGNNSILFLRKRCKQLLIPYFVFGGLLIAFYESLSILSNSSSNLGNYLFRLFSFQGIDSLWFIPCYLVAESFFKLVYIKLPKEIRVTGFIGSIVGMMFLMRNMPDSLILRLLLKILVGVIFIYIGFLVQHYKILRNCTIYVPVTMIICGSILAFVNGFVSIGSLELQNVFLFFAVGSAISIALANIFTRMASRGHTFEVLRVFGQYSIVVLCTNNILIESIHLLDYKLTGNILLHSGILGSLILAIIVSVAEMMIINFAGGKLGVLFGYSK